MVVIHLGFQHMVLNRIWMRSSFLENYLENREILTGEMGGMDTRRKCKITQNEKNLDFPEWKERGDIQQTTNIY